MSNFSIYTKQIWILASDDFITSIKTKRFILLFLLYILSFVILSFLCNHLISSILKEASGHLQMTEDQIIDLSKRAMHDLTRENSQEFNQFFLKYPVLFLTYIFSIFFTFFTSRFLGYDSISGEYSNQSIRYLLIRVPRHIFYLGKFLGLFLQINILILLGFMTVIMISKFSLIPISSFILSIQTTKVLLVCMLYTLIQCGLIIFLSSIIKRPILSLITSFIFPIVLNTLLFKLNWDFLIPTQYLDIHSQSFNFVKPAFFFSVWTALYLSLGLWIFTKKDI